METTESRAEMRAAFEAWYFDGGLPSSKKERERSGDTYKLMRVHLAWRCWVEGWQASRATLPRAGADADGGIAPGSWADLKLSMEASAWEGVIQLDDALANIEEFIAGGHEPPEAPEMPETWHVVAHVAGEPILSIGYDWLSGKELNEAEEQAVIGMARHLLSFVGYGLPPCSFDPEAAPSPASPQGWPGMDLRAKLERFLNAAAGEDLEMDGVDAADLYIMLFPDEHAKAMGMPPPASVEGG